MKVEEIVKALSPEARVALINFGGSRQGTRPPQGMSGDVLDELLQYGLISRNGNLTNRGGLVRDRVLDDALEAL